MPQVVARWRWWTVDPERVGQRPSLTRYHLTEAEAFERFGPNVQRDPNTREEKQVLLPGELPPPNWR